MSVRVNPITDADLPAVGGVLPRPPQRPAVARRLGAVDDRCRGRRTSQPRLPAARRRRGRRRLPGVLLGARDRRPSGAVLQPRRLVRAARSTASTACGCSRRCWRRTATTSPTCRPAATSCRSTSGWASVPRHHHRAGAQPAVAVAAAAGPVSSDPRGHRAHADRPRPRRSTATTPSAAAARHVVLRARRASRCYVVFRRDRRKDLPLFASVLHVSNPELFRRDGPPLARHLLLRHGARRRSPSCGSSADRPRPSVLPAPATARCSAAPPRAATRSTTSTASSSASPGERRDERLACAPNCTTSSPRRPGAPDAPALTSRTRR